MTEQILAVQKMQDYIEAHLTEDITLAALADICSFSPWYAHRLFREHTGYAPAEYVRRMRLAKSALRLKTEQTKIIDVAFDLGFASVDGYTRAFRKEFGINPGEYAKNPVPVKLFVAYGVKFKELRKEFSFVEKADGLVDLINERGQYFVNILGNAEKCCTVTGAKALKYAQEDEIAKVISEADAIFTAVGGKNLKDIAPMLAKGVEAKSKVGGNLNIVTCENWKLPTTILREEIGNILEGDALAFFQTNVGVTEAVIMRSAIESDAEMLAKDPLVVNVQDFWELPVDASRIVGELPPIMGLKLIPEFTGFLERKFYTYNAANGTTSFVGALLGHVHIADAAHDERILPILEGVYMETAQALSKKHNFPLDEQLAFTLTSKRKLQDYTIVDFIERNARDPIRKLGKDDRLVGSARLVQEYGIRPDNLCIAIAAAIHYVSPGDPFAEELVRMRKEEGIDYIIEHVCEQDPNGELGMLIKENQSSRNEYNNKIIFPPADGNPALSGTVYGRAANYLNQTGELGCTSFRHRNNCGWNQYQLRFRQMGFFQHCRWVFRAELTENTSTHFFPMGLSGR